MHGRPLTSLRLSVIDRCDLRCRYCMPEEEYAWLPRRRLLGSAEIAALATAFAELGVTRLRLTGGEPLLRGDLPDLVRRLAAVPGIHDLALTTNGTRLAAAAADLRQAGLQRVTISLDTLRRDRFLQLARRDALEQVLAGIEAACAAGFAAVKTNTVVIRGFNDDEVGDLLDFARRVGAEPRFIEYMDVGGATCWSPAQVVPRREVLAGLRRRFGAIWPEPRHDAAPADRFVLADGTRFGVIASVTEPFCGQCDRSRLTADGLWYVCLYAREGIDLRGALHREGRAGVTRTVRALWRARADRGAEERRRDPGRGVLYQVEELRRDPHREMHTRGG
jgi:GTP 3',8-cyclase